MLGKSSRNSIVVEIAVDATAATLHRIVSALDGKAKFQAVMCIDPNRRPAVIENSMLYVW
jgi:hypothetical protein